MNQQPNLNQGLNMRQDVVCRAIDTDDGWLSVTWEVMIGGKKEFIDSTYGPDLQPKFAASIQNLGASKPSDIIGKTVNARVYENKSGLWKVGPENIVLPSSSTNSVVGHIALKKGNWTFVKDNLTLIFNSKNYTYEVDLERDTRDQVKKHLTETKSQVMTVTDVKDMCTLWDLVQGYVPVKTETSNKPAASITPIMADPSTKMGDTKILKLINRDCWEINAVLKSSIDNITLMSLLKPLLKKLTIHCATALERNSIKKSFPEVYAEIKSFGSSPLNYSNGFKLSLDKFHNNFALLRSKYE